jgi:nucleoid DNA-binding protein
MANGNNGSNGKLNKTQLIEAIVTHAKDSGLTKKHASVALNALQSVAAKQLGKKGPGEVTIPGIAKLSVIVKPAVPARKGINPFTKEPAVFKAKPKRRIVKARVLKGMKDAAL